MNILKAIKDIEGQKPNADSKAELREDKSQSSDAYSKLIIRRNEINEALDAFRQIGYDVKIAEFEAKLNEVELEMEKIMPNKTISSDVIIAEERAGMIEDKINNVTVSQATSIAYKLIEKQLNSIESAKWLKRIDVEQIKGCDLVEKMLRENALEKNPANTTKMINEIFKAEYDGYIENTSGIRASNHIYRVTQ